MYGVYFYGQCVKILDQMWIHINVYENKPKESEMEEIHYNNNEIRRVNI
jgi:hypothetical protein